MPDSDVMQAFGSVGQSMSLARASVVRGPRRKETSRVM